MKVALVYDRVNTPYGGAENVLLAFHELFPEAPLYTAVYDPHRAPWARVFTVRTSFLQHIPFAKQHHRWFVGLMPLAFEQFDFSEFDLIISITSAEAKGILTKPHQLHLCYLLTPTRYLWSHADEYEHEGHSGWLRTLVFRYVRWWDRVAALRPDVYLAISQVVAARCRRYYHREPAAVLYPPVDFTPLPPAKNEYYLVVARLVPYKRIDIAIQACERLGRKLIVIGEGPDFGRLSRLAAQNPHSQVTFLQSVQADKVAAYYSNCRAFLSPAAEDFGITVLEAQAAGKPVIVYQKSGGAEVVQEHITGILMLEQTVESCVVAMQELEKQTWSSAIIQRSVQKYAVPEFHKKMKRHIDALMKMHAEEITYA